jgi:hypothetical protein
MKWFKHDAHSLRKAAVERLIMEYGIEGYGLYYACMEMIAGDIATDDLTFELNHDAELIAHKFKMDTIRVEKIMHRCIELSLFDLADSGRLRCMKLAQMLDETTSRNPEICKLVKGVRNSGVIRDIVPIKSGDSPSRLDKIRLDEIRSDEIRVKRKVFTPPTCEQISEYCNEHNCPIDIDKFIDHYNSNGWKVGNNKMSDWQATVRNWHRRDKDKGAVKGDKPTLEDKRQKYKEMFDAIQ